MGSRWPFPGESPRTRSRKIAWAYRAELQEVAPERAAELDARFVSWDESWVCPTRSFAPDDLVTANEAGTLIGKSGRYVSAMRVNGWLKGKRDGKRYLFKVSDVFELAERRSFTISIPKDTVTANGRSVSNDAA